MIDELGCKNSKLPEIAKCLSGNE